MGVDELYELTGQTALVTGAAQGIGFGIARELAKAGSRIIIGDLNLERANQAADDLQAETGREVVALPLDVTDAKSIQDCVSVSIDRFTRVDILVNNAGMHCEKVGQVSTPEHFNRCFEVNLFGVWRMTLSLVPHFKAHRTGKIVNIASINGRIPWADTPAYSASKAAVINLTRSLAITLGPENINVNAVCPGGVMTAMADLFTHNAEDMEKEMIRSRVIKRPLFPEDIGHAVVFFASSRARSITGQALNVDGGAVMS